MDRGGRHPFLRPIQPENAMIIDGGEDLRNAESMTGHACVEVTVMFLAPAVGSIFCGDFFLAKQAKETLLPTSAPRDLIAQLHLT
jgi:hypothetical protein